MNSRMSFLSAQDKAEPGPSRAGVAPYGLLFELVVTHERFLPTYGNFLTTLLLPKD